MKVTPRVSDTKRRHKIKAAQGKEDANDLVIKHTCSGGGAMTADEEMIGS
jgi:hypothetical protein